MLPKVMPATDAVSLPGSTGLGESMECTLKVK